jgi:thymidylate synthase (FAD)
VEFEPEFYIPEFIRIQSKDNKQGSHGNANDVIIRGKSSRVFFEERCMEQYNAYVDMVSLGLAKEQARMLLPQNVYSECILTQSLQSILFFLEQRLKPDAQWEIRQYALGIKDLIEPMFIGLDL